MPNQTKRNIIPFCEARDCQDTPTQKISVKVKEGIITLQVCELCGSKFILYGNISSFSYCIREREYPTDKKSEKLPGTLGGQPCAAPKATGVAPTPSPEGDCLEPLGGSFTDA